MLMEKRIKFDVLGNPIFIHTYANICKSCHDWFVLLGRG